MKYDTMNEYTMAKYFESLCNSFYIAYTQGKRLEEQREELEKNYPDKELEIVEKLIELSKISSSNELKEKYAEQKFSQEQLEKRKEKLKMQKEACEDGDREIQYQLNFWLGKIWNTVKNIKQLLYRMKNENLSIIITSEEEIVALIAVFRSESQAMDKFANIINTKEESLKSFPTSELCQAFLRAYQLKNKEEMEQVIEKYF